MFNSLSCWVVKNIGFSICLNLSSRLYGFLKEANWGQAWTLCLDQSGPHPNALLINDHDIVMVNMGGYAHFWSWDNMPLSKAPPMDQWDQFRFWMHLSFEFGEEMDVFPVNHVLETIFQSFFLKFVLTFKLE